MPLAGSDVPLQKEVALGSQARYLGLCGKGATGKSRMRPEGPAEPWVWSKAMCRCHRQFLPMLKPSQLKELKSMQHRSVVDLSRDPSETYKGGVGPKRFTRPEGFVCRLYPGLPDRRGSKGGRAFRPKRIRRCGLRWSWVSCRACGAGWADQPTDEGPGREERDCEIQA